MSEEVARREPTPAELLVAQVQRPDFQAAIALALPEGMAVSRFVRVAATALLEKPEIAELERGSVYNALLKAAGDGLLPDGREAALAPYKGKAVYMPMIGGFRKIAAEHGWAMETRVVYEKDSFEYELGARPVVRHRPAPLGQPRGKIVAAYAIGRDLDTGTTLIEVMSREEIDKVRKSAKTDEIWKAWEERMTAKTVGRRLFKSLPIGDRDRVRRMLEASDLEAGEARAAAYGSAGHDGESEVPPEASEASSASDGEPGSDVEAPGPAPFTGDEPDEETEAEAEALAAARDVPLTFGKHEGETLGSLADNENKTYLRWLASDAVTDAELRAAAALVLKSVTS